jgi:hypothetical protein
MQVRNCRIYSNPSGYSMFRAHGDSLHYIVIYNT